MRDRVPTYPGRVRLIPVAGQDNLYDITRADDAITEGMPLCKATLLPDSVCDALGIDREESTPADALLAIPAVLGKALLRITAKHADGSAYAGLQINGITGVDAARCVTDDAGKLMVYVSEGSYTLSSAEATMYIDTTTAAVSVTMAAGQIKDVTIQETAKTTKRLEIKTTQNIMFSRNVASVDVFCVGAGGGGGDGQRERDAGGGGGGGYTITKLGIAPTTDVPLAAVIGAGGSADGGQTSFMGVAAAGGKAGAYQQGGNGGSGGGTPNANGGTDGLDGKYSSAAGPSRRGIGQGTSTRAFGDSTEKTYAGGGGGGGYGRGGLAGGQVGGEGGKSSKQEGQNAAANTGGGGGGGGYEDSNASSSHESGGNGGSGIIIIRWRTKT